MPKKKTRFEPIDHNGMTVYTCRRYEVTRDFLV